MAQYNKMVLTQDGLSLLAKGQTGVAIVYTRAAIGDGYLPDGTTLNTLTALVHETMSLAISSISASDLGLVTVRTSLSNQGLLVGMYVREVGLFATDPDEGEILYCVANADDLADYLPPEGTDVVEEVLNLNTIIGNAENVSAVISVSLVYATAQDLDDLRSETNSALETKETPAGAQTKADAAAAIGVTAAGVVAEALGEHKADYAHHYKKDAGSTDAYVVALDPVITAYTEGMTLDIFCKTANAGAATLDAGGGAKDLRKYYNDALETGDIEAGAIITVKWDSANDWWQVTSGIKVTVNAASETVAGVTEYATVAEVTAGTSTTTAVTPAGAKVELDKKALVAVGSYTGDGTASRAITVGFRSKFLRIQSTETSGSNQFEANDNGSASVWVRGTSPNVADNFGGMTSTGFVTGSNVTDGMNASGKAFRWVANG